MDVEKTARHSKRPGSYFMVDKKRNNATSRTRLCRTLFNGKGPYSVLGRPDDKVITSGKRTEEWESPRRRGEAALQHRLAKTSYRCRGNPRSTTTIPPGAVVCPPTAGGSRVSVRSPPFRTRKSVSRLTRSRRSSPYEGDPSLPERLVRRFTIRVTEAV